LDQSSTYLRITIPEDPRVPEFTEVKVHCFESSTMEAHQVCARRALKEVYNQLGETQGHPVQCSTDDGLRP
jgi:hypothetical protein